jgi:hypothetical protein
LLAAIAANPGASQAQLATKLGWVLKDGSPYKSLVKRTTDKLIKHRLVAEERDGIEITEKGRKCLKS